MTEREFSAWLRYAQKRLMPSQRIEAYLAQVASVIAQSVGNDVKISDFILDFGAKPRKASKEDARAFAAMLPGTGVRKLGQGRKKKATNG
jgi:hypothetical protein